MSSAPAPHDPSRAVATVVETRLAEPRFRTTVTPTTNNPGSLGVDDVYYTVFRHKWKIVICSVLGTRRCRAAFYLTQKPNYESSAKLFVRYVVTEGRVARPSGDVVETKSPDSRGETIIQSELEILKSLDLATKVAQAVGPEKILFKLGGGNELTRCLGRSTKGTNGRRPPAAAV
jgi:hypothetical protein